MSRPSFITCIVGNPASNRIKCGIDTHVNVSEIDGFTKYMISPLNSNVDFIYYDATIELWQNHFVRIDEKFNSMMEKSHNIIYVESRGNVKIMDDDFFIELIVRHVRKYPHKTAKMIVDGQIVQMFNK